MQNGSEEAKNGSHPEDDMEVGEAETSSLDFKETGDREKGDGSEGNSTKEDMEEENKTKKVKRTNNEELKEIDTDEHTVVKATRSRSVTSPSSDQPSISSMFKRV